MIRYLSLFACLAFSSAAQNLPIRFQDKAADGKIEVYAGSELFTAYLFDSDHSIKKPVLYPVISPEGNFVSRGWPLDPREGERTDHPHHIGIWFNHGDVNGNDFWNNSYERDLTKRHYGIIHHTGVKKIKEGKKSGELITTADWFDFEGKKLIEEESKYTFSATENLRIIDREITLKAATDLLFADNKEGMIALRLAKELEHADPKVNYTPSGEYTNDLGIKGTEVWGKRSEWMRLTGQIRDENLTVAIFDHPDNHNFPGHWHARGYGLYAVNNIGSDVFTKGVEVSDISVPEGGKIKFKYRIIIASKHLTEDEMVEAALQFQK
ncbi:PmoA family protein [Jiulongibacter sediminis]|jgi:hypothetical protein|uniref:DUF6807 domain-containing protein n=1 Tax=Jiulongibacter sediminis TaxID=1605367 RepID=UPI0026EC8F11|nr:PmoA family protein [Jiulongibacter sediminis]